MPELKEAKARQAVVDLAQKFLHVGLVVRTWGNFSTRLNQESFLITPSGRSYENMAASEICKVSLADGKTTEQGGGKPSSESPMHALAYRLFPQVKVIAHTHQVYASAISLLDEDLPIPAHWQSLLGSSLLPVSAYGLPGSKNLHRNMENTLRRTKASMVLMSRHGALILAETSAACVRLATDLELFALEVYEKRLGRPGNHRLQLHSDSELEAQLMSSVPSSKEAIAISADPEVRPWLNRKLSPYLDDFAQICGVSASSRRGSNSLVFDPARGVAICYGQNLAEARNVRAVLEKNARAANIAEQVGTAAIPQWEAWGMRLVYKLRYSKQAGK